MHSIHAPAAWQASMPVMSCWKKRPGGALMQPAAHVQEVKQLARLPWRAHPRHYNSSGEAHPV